MAEDKVSILLLGAGGREHARMADAATSGRGGDRE